MPSYVKNCLLHLTRALAAGVIALCAMPAAAAVNPTVKSALLVFYNNTNGASWTNNTGWSNPDSDPCDDNWFGVTCHLGQVLDLDLPANGLTGTANLAYMPQLSRLDVSDNALTGLVLSNLPELQQLVADDNQFPGTISLANFPRLGFVRLSRNQLTGLDLSNLPELAQLEVGNNQLTGLDLSNLPELTQLEIGNNRLSALALADLPKLSEVDAKDNPLTSVALANLPELLELDVSTISLFGLQPQLTTLNLADLPKLKKLVAENSGIAQLTLANLPALERLEIYGNQLAALNLADLPKLDYINAQGNRVADMTLANLPSLTQVTVALNALTALNLTDLPKLERVDASFNRIASVALGNLPALERLNLGFNALTALNLSGLPLLTDVAAPANQIASADLSGLPDGLSSLNLAGNRLQGAAPTLRPAQAAALAAGSKAVVCPNAVAQAATPDAQNALWQQATGKNPWDAGCNAQWATGRTTYTVQADPPGSATAQDVPQSLAMGDWALASIEAAPGYVLAALDAPAPCTVVGVPAPNSFYSGTLVLLAMEPGACSITIKTQPVTAMLPPQWQVPITVAVTGSGRHAPAASPMVHGVNQSFSYAFTPEPGFALESVTGCDGTLTGNRYTGTATTACTINATFSGSAVITPATPTPVPALGTWALGLLAAMLGVLGWRKAGRYA